MDHHQVLESLDHRQIFEPGQQKSRAVCESDEEEQSVEEERGPSDSAAFAAIKIAISCNLLLIIYLYLCKLFNLNQKKIKIIFIACMYVHTFIYFFCNT